MSVMSCGSIHDAVRVPMLMNALPDHSLSLAYCLCRCGLSCASLQHISVFMTLSFLCFLFGILFLSLSLISSASLSVLSVHVFFIYLLCLVTVFLSHPLVSLLSLSVSVCRFLSLLLCHSACYSYPLIMIRHE